MASPNYKVDPQEERLTAVTDEMLGKVEESDKMHDNMIGQVDAVYQNQINTLNEATKLQEQQLNAEHEFAVQKIEQQKEQSEKDYIKEQSAAYTDWKKQSNQYGANAERMAASGLSNSGYSETAQVMMYNNYQNRVASARESFVVLKQNYDNAMVQAKLQNSSALAQLALDTLEKSLEITLEGFQYKNNLIAEKAKQRRAIENEYHSRYMDVLNQINTENKLNEEARQYDTNLKLQTQILENETPPILENPEEQPQIKSSTALEAVANAIGGAFSPNPAISKAEQNRAQLSAYNQVEKMATLKKDISSIKTYDQAVNFLKENGIKGIKVMPTSEWLKKRRDFENTGIGSVEVSKYNTYADYIHDLLSFSLEDYFEEMQNDGDPNAVKSILNNTNNSAFANATSKAVNANGNTKAENVTVENEFLKEIVNSIIANATNRAYKK